MKRISIIIITILLTFSGCTEFLTIQPQDELIKEEYWKTEGDVVAVLGSTYGGMSKILDDIYYWSEIRGGLISPNEKKVTVSTLEFFNFSLNENNEKLQWGDFYNVINKANSVIKFAPLAKENDMTFTDVAFNGYLAEAHFIRNLCYFYLVRAFKEVPYITEPYATDEQDFSIEKSSEDFILDAMISDLNNIINMAFKSDYYLSGDARNKGRVNQNAIYALLADIHLWNNDYQECINNCDKIKDIYLLDGKNYFSLYAGSGNSVESIFELQFDYYDYETTNDLYKITSNGSNGAKEFLVSEILIGLYSSIDTRQYSNSASVTYNPTTRALWKYEGQSPYDPADKFRVDRSSNRSDANWIFYRLAEIHLMKAEAYAEMDNLSNALTELNIIKERAGIPLDFETIKEKIISGILDERAKEFVGEGKRWFDMVRITRRNKESRFRLISDAVMLNVDPKSRSAVENKLKDTDSWFLPIHFKELQLNKKLKQNAFYD